MSTYTPIATQTLSSAAASVTFDGIPQTYTDLVLVTNYGGTSAGQIFQIQFNGDTGSNYSSTLIRANSGGVGSSRTTNQNSINVWNNGCDTSIASNGILHFMNYSNTTTNKTVVGRTNSNVWQYSGPDAGVGLWRSTAAINSIQITISSGNMLSGSTFTLYGIGSGSPKAFGGDEVRTDGTYWYHIYRSSGIFAPMQDLSCDYLVVAGGGSGGGYVGGGGGAGGLRSTITATGGGGSLESPLSLTAGANYTVTIGAGAAGGAGFTDQNNGSNSVFATVTSIGGGSGARGGGAGVSGGSTGGSGGGGGSVDDNKTGFAGTANQGYAGGSSAGASGNYGSGGGGGAGSTGYPGGSSGGNGGVGVATSISGSSVTYAGGGGGAEGGGGTPGTGGTGGGGNGANGNGDGSVAVSSTAGTVNTGGGGGGGGLTSNNVFCQSGGSGIVVVRYAV